MNTHTFDVTKDETHDFVLIMGQTSNFETTINENQYFNLILDEFQENSSFVVKIITPIRIAITELKQKLLPTVSIKVLNNISITTKLKEYYTPIIRVANKIIATPILYQHQDITIRTPVFILVFARMLLKIFDTRIIMTNRITITPVLKKYKFLSEFDPQLLTDLDMILLKDMDYEVL
jgi:hypothetical protein